MNLVLCVLCVLCAGFGWVGALCVCVCVCCTRSRVCGLLGCECVLCACFGCVNVLCACFGCACALGVCVCALCAFFFSFFLPFWVLVCCSCVVVGGSRAWGYAVPKVRGLGYSSHPKSCVDSQARKRASTERRKSSLSACKEDVFAPG